MRSLVKLAMLLALGGCEQPGAYDRSLDSARRAPALPATSIATSADAYGAGAPVSIRLTNTTARTVGYNLCRAKLERSHDNDWQEIMPALGEVCTAELRGLRPGQSATFVFRTPPGARGGTYRVRAALQDPQGAALLEAISNTFTVTRESD
jgi:hypothetical protein